MATRHAKKFHLKTQLATLLIFGCMTANAAPQLARQNDQCNEEGAVAHTEKGNVLMCQERVFLPPLVGPSNIRLAPGQTAIDEAGCLYAVARRHPKAELALIPLKENGEQICSLYQQRDGVMPPWNGWLNKDTFKDKTK